MSVPSVGSVASRPPAALAAGPAAVGGGLLSPPARQQAFASAGAAPAVAPPPDGRPVLQTANQDDWSSATASAALGGHFSVVRLADKGSGPGSGLRHRGAVPGHHWQVSHGTGAACGYCQFGCQLIARRCGGIALPKRPPCMPLLTAAPACLLAAGPHVSSCRPAAPQCHPAGALCLLNHWSSGRGRHFCGHSPGKHVYLPPAAEGGGGLRHLRL